MEAELIRNFPLNNPRLTDLHNTLDRVLNELKNDTNVFETLLGSFPNRLQQVRTANGGYTNY